MIGLIHRLLFGESPMQRLSRRFRDRIEIDRSNWTGEIMARPPLPEDKPKKPGPRPIHAHDAEALYYSLKPYLKASCDHGRLSAVVWWNYHFTEYRHWHAIKWRELNFDEFIDYYKLEVVPDSAVLGHAQKV